MPILSRDSWRHSGQSNVSNVAHDKRTMADWKTGTPKWIDFDLGIHRKVIRTVSPSWNQKWNPTTDRICRSLPTNLPITTKNQPFIFRQKYANRPMGWFVHFQNQNLSPWMFVLFEHSLERFGGIPCRDSCGPNDRPSPKRIPEKWILTFTQKKGHGCHWCARTLKNVLLKCPPGSLTPRKFQHTPRAHPRQCPWPTMKGIPL